MSKETAKQYNARVQKWREMIEHIGDDKKLLKKRLRKGVPQGLRIKVWPLLVNLNAYRKKYGDNYEALLKLPSPCERQILLDIDRTFTQQKQQVLKGSLKNVLHALSLLHPQIGYCQGMNTLVMRMLETLDDQTSFWMTSYLINLFPLLRMNLRNPRSCQLQNYILQKLILYHMPYVAKTIKKQDILLISFAPRWWITLLTSSLPRQTLFRVYDTMLLQGYKVVYRAALAMLKIKQRQILHNNYETNQRYISGAIDVYEKVSPDDFIELMFGFSMSRAQIAGWEKEFLQKDKKFFVELDRETQESETRRREQAAQLIRQRELEKQKGADNRGAKSNSASNQRNQDKPKTSNSGGVYAPPPNLNPGVFNVKAMTPNESTNSHNPSYSQSSTHLTIYQTPNYQKKMSNRPEQPSYSMNQKKSSREQNYQPSQSHPDNSYYNERSQPTYQKKQSYKQQPKYQPYHPTYSQAPQHPSYDNHQTPSSTASFSNRYQQKPPLPPPQQQRPFQPHYQQPHQQPPQYSQQYSQQTPQYQQQYNHQYNQQYNQHYNGNPNSYSRNQYRNEHQSNGFHPYPGKITYETVTIFRKIQPVQDEEEIIQIQNSPRQTSKPSWQNYNRTNPAFFQSRQY